MVAALEETMRQRTREILDRVAEQGECDFVVDVAAELPLQVIADLMGVPQEDRHKIFDWSNRMIGGEDPEYGAAPKRTAAMASMELYAYSSELAAQARPTRTTTSSASSPRPRSTARGSPTSRSTCSSCCSRSPATRPPATSSRTG